VQQRAADRQFNGIHKCFQGRKTLQIDLEADRNARQDFRAESNITFSQQSQPHVINIPQIGYDTKQCKKGFRASDFY
jgi:hypothetical protein